MINPKISVIVPVYNAEKTISKCIQSLLEQTFQEFELILVNDGSKDNSLQLLKEFEEHHSNFKVIDQVNGGASIARNTGLDAASGDYIVFVDIDDYLDSDYLDVLYQEIVKTGNDIVISSLRMVDNQGKVVSQIVLDDTSGDNWSQYIITTPYTRIFKKAFLDSHSLKFIDYTMEDIHFNAVAFSKTKNVSTMSYIGYNNYVNPASTTRTDHQGIRKDIDFLYLLSCIHRDVKPNDLVTFLYKKSYMYYLLFSGKASSSKVFLEEHTRILSWLKENHLESNMSPFNSKVKAERFNVKVIMFIFSCLEKSHLLPLFAKIYCKK